MFGYVRPLKGELKVSEFERYKAAYCGLCRALLKGYGLPASFALSYDLTFLQMLLDTGTARFEKCVCPACPFKRKSCTAINEAAEKAAGCSVILVRHKLRDSVQDSSFFGKILPSAEGAILTPAYRKAKKSFPQLDGVAEENLKRLEKLGEPNE